MPGTEFSLNNPCLLGGILSPDAEHLSSRTLVCLFKDRVSLCNAGCSGTHYVEQVDLKLTEIHLPLPLNCWD